MRALPVVVAAALAAAALAACTTQGGAPTTIAVWQGLRGAPADRALAAFGTPESVEQQGDSRVYVYRRFRVMNREPVAPIMTPQGQIVTPRPANAVELCETRVRVDASGRVSDIAQTGGSCAELMPPPA